MKKQKQTLIALALTLAASGVQAQKVRLNNQSRWGFEHESLGWIEIQAPLRDGGEFSEGLASVKVGKKWGFINSLGNIVIDPQFDSVREFHDGFAAACKDKQWGIIDTAGNTLIPFEYETTEGFYDGLAMVRKDGKYGYVNADNVFVISPIFTDATSFSLGLAAVRENQNGKFGYIDRQGNYQIPPTYDQAEGFVNGIAQVKANGRKFFVDSNGSYYAKREEALLAAEAISRRQVAQNTSNAASGFVGDPLWADGGVAQTIPPTPNVQVENLREYLLRCQLDSSEITALVARKLKEWQKKGNYETKANYEERISAANVENKRRELTEDYEQKYNTYIIPYLQAYHEAMKNDFMAGNTFSLHEYDAETQRFRIFSDKLGEIYVGVPEAKADQFRAQWGKILGGLGCKFIPHGDDMVLTEVNFAGFKYEPELPPLAPAPGIADPAVTLMAQENAAVTSDSRPDTPAAPEQAAAPQTTAEDTFVSDVDMNIPEGINPDAGRTFAIIIGNEHYSEPDATDVPFALNDARSMKEYCMRTLGLPEKNIMFRTDATLNQMRSEMRRIRDVARVMGGNIKVLFYYAGHGIPNESGTDSYLLPADGIPADPRSAYRLSELYDELGNLGAESVTVFLDACFSGAKRSGGLMMATRGVAFDVPEAEPSGNMVVFSAASGEETALPHTAQRHGLFTYYLLKNLQATGGSSSYKDMAEYIRAEVNRYSVIDLKKAQTPTVQSSYDLAQNWSHLSLNSSGVGVDDPLVSVSNPHSAPAPVTAPASEQPALPAISISEAAAAAAVETPASNATEDDSFSTETDTHSISETGMETPAEAGAESISLPISPTPETPAETEEKTVSLPISPAPETPAETEEKTVSLPISPAPETPAETEEKTISLPISPAPETPAEAVEETVSLPISPAPETPAEAVEETVSLPISPMD